jgi:tripartite ATP-independent transporter DctP family solute receptor
MLLRTIAFAASLDPAALQANAQELRYAHMKSPGHDVHKWGERVKAAVERRTGGAVRMTMFPRAQLGENAQVTEQVTLGADIVTQVGPGHLANFNPDYQILSGPFLFRSWDEVTKLLASDLGKAWEARLAASNVKLLCFANYGLRDFYAIKAPIRRPADAAGLKIRVQPLPIYTEMVRAIGGAPTPMPWPEVYSALAQGVIDVAEAPPAAMLDQKHFERARFYMLSNHTIETVPFIMSQRTLARLRPEHQRIVEEEAKAACDWLTGETLKNYEAEVKQVEARGVTIVRDVDRAAFAEATRVVYTKFPAWTPNLYERVRAAIGQ